ncbi:unnamed protein product [Brassica oleracea var. botrytis]
MLGLESHSELLFDRVKGVMLINSDCNHLVHKLLLGTRYGLLDSTFRGDSPAYIQAWRVWRTY